MDINTTHHSKGKVAVMREVVFVDGVRTPFGRAGEKGRYGGTRVADLAGRAVQGLLEPNPPRPLERVDDVGIAAATQQGDRGLTLGRSVASLAGLPVAVPRCALVR